MTHLHDNQVHLGLGARLEVVDWWKRAVRRALLWTKQVDLPRTLAGVEAEDFGECRWAERGTCDIVEVGDADVDQGMLKGKERSDARKVDLSREQLTVSLTFHCERRPDQPWNPIARTQDSGRTFDTSSLTINLLSVVLKNSALVFPPCGSHRDVLERLSMMALSTPIRLRM